MRLVVLGAGESGVGAAILGLKKGYEVFVSDLGAIADAYKLELENYGIDFEENIHTQTKILNADIVVKSPGIPDKAPLIVKLNEANIPVISEIEFAGKYNNAKTICVTGSNGKTTTVNLIYRILKDAGLNVALAGNIGDSFAKMVALEHHDYYVLELSSFQLDGMFHFKADVAVLGNITPDHLDRYDFDFSKYVDSKFRILQNMTSEDTFIYNEDDEVITEKLKQINPICNLLPFSQNKELSKGAYTLENTIKIYTKNRFNMHQSDLGLNGKHNTYNSMAAALAANVFDIKNESIRDSLTDFQGVEHRMEPVAKVRGVEFINDSKATNVNSTWYALESMDKPVVWLAGGTDKGNNYNELKYLVKDKVKALICIGEDNSKLIDSFQGVISDIIEAENMEEAINAAYFIASKNEVVLLSPACASFDRFKSYEDRGNQFKALVRNL